jgi:hypothetical protein
MMKCGVRFVVPTEFLNVIYEGNSKSKVPYLNKIATYRVSHET